MTSQQCVQLPPEVKRHKTPSKDAAPSKSAVEMRFGYRTLYLGSIPTTDITSTETSVSLLLDRFRLGSINDEDIFLDATICGLIMYFVDNKDKIVKTKIFDISRISFCSGDHVIDPCVFAWVYHQETREGFRHECHAVKASNERKARYLAVLLNNAFTQLYHEVQAALSSSRLFHEARCVEDQNRNIKPLPKRQSNCQKPSGEGNESDTKSSSEKEVKVAYDQTNELQEKEAEVIEKEKQSVPNTETCQDNKNETDTKDVHDKKDDVITEEVKEESTEDT